MKWFKRKESKEPELSYIAKKILSDLEKPGWVIENTAGILIFRHLDLEYVLSILTFSTYIHNLSSQRIAQSLTSYDIDHIRSKALDLSDSMKIQKDRELTEKVFKK